MHECAELPLAVLRCDVKGLQPAPKCAVRLGRRRRIARDNEETLLRNLVHFTTVELEYLSLMFGWSSDKTQPTALGGPKRRCEALVEDIHIELRLAI